MKFIIIMYKKFSFCRKDSNKLLEVQLPRLAHLFDEFLQELEVPLFGLFILILLADGPIKWIIVNHLPITQKDEHEL